MAPVPPLLSSLSFSPRRFRFLLVVTCFFVFVTVVLTSASFYIRSIIQKRTETAIAHNLVDPLVNFLHPSNTTTQSAIPATPAADSTRTASNPTLPTTTKKDVPHDIHEHKHKEDSDSHSHVFDTAHGHTHEVLTPAQLERQKQQEIEKKVMAGKCKAIADQYGIKTGETWGTAQNLPDVKAQWGADDCDTYLALHSYDEYILQHPELFEAIIVPADRIPPPPKRNASTILISVCICTTTRGLELKKMEDLTLFKQLLPSIAETAEEGYEYRVYLLYDTGDSYFDNSDRIAAVEAWFTVNVAKPMAERGIVGRLVLSKYDNKAQKPGPAFNYITNLAYIDGSDYIYRINDDTYFVSPYSTHFIAALTEMGPPYGAVGPLCREGNTWILTHDFVHRLHHELMRGWHYPPTLTDWWMDDWISRVYGRRRTRRVDQVIVKHMMLSHGTRYGVTWEHAALVGTEVELGRQKIEGWMERHNLTKELQIYQNDEFKFTMHSGPQNND